MKNQELKPGIWSYTGVLPEGEDSRKLNKRLIELDENLVLMHGEKINPLDEELIDALIHIILTQNTTDVNSDRTFKKLMETFSNWEEMRTSDAEKIADAIRMGGLAEIKSYRIIQVLNMIRARDVNYDLSFVGDMEPDEAMIYLMSMPGVGPKSAACSLLFSMDKPTFPVDTHVHRVSNRLGLVHTKDLKQTQLKLAPLVEVNITYQLHVNMVHHGRKLCKAIHPRCGDCLLFSECKYAKVVE